MSTLGLAGYGPVQYGNPHFIQEIEKKHKKSDASIPPKNVGVF